MNYENITELVLFKGILQGKIYLYDKDDKGYEYTEPIMLDIHDFIWEYEQELGRETTDEEWVRCRNDWLIHFCISNGIKSLRVEGEELLKKENK